MSQQKSRDQDHLKSDPIDHSSLNHLNDQIQSIILDEVRTLGRVMESISVNLKERELLFKIDQELIELRDQIREARAEDQASLLEHMTRLAALRNVRIQNEDRQSDEEFISSPYFARICYEEENEDGEVTGKKKEVLIGKKSFFSEDGRVKVVDWRSSPISQLYYCMREGDYFYEKIGARYLSGTLTLRRTLSIKEGQVLRIQYGEEGREILTRDHLGVWQSHLQVRSSLSGGEGVATRVNPSHLGRNRLDARLPEITALIDPEQFKLITHEQSGVVIIQGGAGTGKTTIALHRVAYLHFQNKKRYQPNRILIITPGEALKRYVAQVLPSLDVDGVPISTFEDWGLKTVKKLIPQLSKYKKLEDTPLGAQRLKRHPLLIRLIEQAIYTEGREMDHQLESLGGAEVLTEWVKRRNLPIMERIKKLITFIKSARPVVNPLCLKFLLEAENSISNPFNTWLDLLTNRELLERSLKQARVAYYQWELKQLVETTRTQAQEPERFDDLDREYQVGVDGKRLEGDPYQGRLDTDDCAILLRICQLKYGRLTGPSRHYFSYEHIMVDEAQDLSPISLQVLCHSTPVNAPITLAGDTAQRIVFNNGFSQWREVMPYLPKRSTLLPPLTISYRSTRQVMSFARDLLGDLVHDWSTRDMRDGAPVSYFRFEELGESISFIADALTLLMQREPNATVALVSRNPDIAQIYYESLKHAGVPKIRWVRQQEFTFEAGIDITNAVQIKGLEYDYVIALGVNADDYPVHEHARHLLHVIVTRAAYQLWVISSAPTSPSALLPKKLIETGVLTGNEHEEQAEV